MLTTTFFIAAPYHSIHNTQLLMTPCIKHKIYLLHVKSWVWRSAATTSDQVGAQPVCFANSFNYVGKANARLSAIVKIYPLHTKNPILDVQGVYIKQERLMNVKRSL